MIGGMPILRQNDVREPSGEAIDDRNHLVAARNRQRAARAEIILNIDYKENVALPGSHAAHRAPQYCKNGNGEIGNSITQYRLALRVFNCQEAPQSGAAFAARRCCSPVSRAVNTTASERSGRRPWKRPRRQAAQGREGDMHREYEAAIGSIVGWAKAAEALQCWHGLPSAFARAIRPSNCEVVRRGHSSTSSEARGGWCISPSAVPSGFAHANRHGRLAAPNDENRLRRRLRLKGSGAGGFGQRSILV